MKLDVSLWWDRVGMRPLLTALGADDGLVRFVGGAVRDQLLGLPVSDIDLATPLNPQQVIARLEKAGLKAVPTGIDHGTVTAVSHGQPAEVTTLRRDVSTDGRRATVAFTDDWKEDAARRDFTINALMADPTTGELFDYFGGISDIQDRRVRFIGEPLQRIAEDHLRILRFFRFHARFGQGAPDQASLEACTARSRDLMALSRERIADELLKLLAVTDPSPTVELMLSRGILKSVVPEIEVSAVERMRRLIAAEQAAALSPAPIRRLSALLPPDPELAERIAARLKLPNKVRKRLASAAIPVSEGSPEALAYSIGTEGAVDRLLLAGREAQAMNIADWPVPRLPISGGALIERGVAQGPEVAATLRRIETRWVERDFPSGESFDRLVDEVLASP